MRQDCDKQYLLKVSCAYISGKKQSMYSPAKQEVRFSFSFQCPHGLKQEHCVIIKSFQLLIKKKKKKFNRQN